MSFQKLIGLLFALALTGCAGAPERLPIVTANAALGAEHPIIVATSCAPTADPLRPYGPERYDTLSCEEIGVWVPKDRKPGSVSYPSKKPKIKHQFAATRTVAHNCNGLTDVLNKKLDETGENAVFVFVHGYNVDYAEGVYRQAQFIHDFHITAPALQYSWPSSGKLLRYLYDRDSATFARDGLVKMLNDVAASEADNIIVLAHSMGALLTMEAVRQLDQTGRVNTIDMISPLILASPDIDADVFRAEITALTHSPKPIVVFASTRDKALWFSQRLRGGHPRVGEAKDIAMLRQLGIIVLDLSTVTDGDRINHSTFASSPTIIKMVDDGDLTLSTLEGADQQANKRSQLGSVKELVAGVLYFPFQVLGAD